ncbi:LysR family transcriptional regulator [Clostridium sp. E02]|uniref:LysR family transcriptional regulator n=1 Tax=Clostridium sp. E02 TaxID=2487134 RepID=UPI000F54417D|nr:LysR family transcriptional regulator [Clostridium sp. E02]
MDFKDLNYILAVSKYQNITKAANSLYISQPTLTKFLQNLESDLGQKLFKKIGNRFMLTYAGERYVKKAGEILQLKKELDNELSDIIKSNIGVLNIAFPVMRGTYMLPCTLPIFRSLYPNVIINIKESASATLESMILSGETDLAFFNKPVKSPEVDYEVISHEEMLLIMSVDHPLADRGVTKNTCTRPWFDLTLLQEERLILQETNQRSRLTVDRIFQQVGFQPQRILITSNIRAGAELVSKNYGVAFVTDTHLKHMNFLDKLMCFSFGTPSTMVDFVAAYRKGSYLNHHANEYIKIVKDFT